MQDRDVALDGLRGVAIGLVVLCHASAFAGATGFWGRVLFAFPAVGWAGVDLFFVLSGFLITRILLQQREAGNYFRAFYGRRILRIFPVYYVVLAFVFFAIPAMGLGGPQHFWSVPDGEPLWYWVHLSNFYDGLGGRYHHGLMAVAWSLAIEEQFYLLWPLLVSRLNVKHLRTLCLGLIVTAFALRCAAVAMDASPLLTYMLTPMRMDGLAVGAWLAATARIEGLGSWVYSARRALVGKGAVIAAIVFAIQVKPDLFTTQWNTVLTHPLMQTIGYSALAVFFGALLVLALEEKGGRLERFLAARPLQILGKYSYAIYLLHLPLITMVVPRILAALGVEWSFFPTQLLRYAIIFPLVTFAGFLSWHGIERHAHALRRFFPYGAPPARAESA